MHHWPSPVFLIFWNQSRSLFQNKLEKWPCECLLDNLEPTESVLHSVFSQEGFAKEQYVHYAETTKTQLWAILVSLT